MNRLKTLAIALSLPVVLCAQGWQENYGGVMLQGFFWDSFTDTRWTNIESQAAELAESFSLIWVPQSGNCATGHNVMGYTPVYWYDQNSSFGTEAELRSMIKALKDKGTGVVADVVVNHRGSVGKDGSWVDFPAETYRGTTYQLGLADICRNDDGGETAKRYNITGANDTGDDWSGMRDLDHTSANVQANIKAYLGFLKEDMGYTGFRYDMTKGFGAEYVAMYNAAAQPDFSVGEYWDGYAPTVKGWIDRCADGGARQSASFDFPLRYSLRDACMSGTWSKLAAGGLATDNNYKRYAVTFVDNHDTQYRSESYKGDPISQNILAANAYILATPGTPCVFLPHWKQYKKDIKLMIAARRLAGVTNQSAHQTMTSAATQYVVKTTGTKAALIVALGADPGQQEGYTRILSGTNYNMYIQNTAEAVWAGVPSGEYTNGQTVTLTAVSADDAARIAYTTDGSEPTATSTSIVSGQSVQINTTATLKAGLLTAGTVKNVITRQYTITPFQAHKATVYLKDPGWESLYLYSWDSTGELLGKWPGTAWTTTANIGGQKYYKQEFDVNSPEYSFNVIFNLGMNKAQTIDIGPINTDRYYEIAGMAGGKYTVNDITQTITAIEQPAITGAPSTMPVSVYSASGTLLRTLPPGTTAETALNGLSHGVYIVNGKKMAR